MSNPEIPFGLIQKYYASSSKYKSKKRMDAKDIEPILLSLNLPPIFGLKEAVKIFCSHLSIDEKDWGFQEYGLTSDLPWVHYNVRRAINFLVKQGKFIRVSRGLYTVPKTTKENLKQELLLRMKKRTPPCEIKNTILSLSLPKVFSSREVVEAFCSHVSIDEKDWGMKREKNKDITRVDFNVRRAMRHLFEEGNLVRIRHGLYTFPKDLAFLLMDEKKKKKKNKNKSTENTLCSYIFDTNLSKAEHCLDKIEDCIGE